MLANSDGDLRSNFTLRELPSENLKAIVRSVALSLGLQLNCTGGLFSSLPKAAVAITWIAHIAALAHQATALKPPLAVAHIYPQPAATAILARVPATLDS